MALCNMRITCIHQQRMLIMNGCKMQGLERKAEKKLHTSTWVMAAIVGKMTFGSYCNNKATIINNE